MKRMAHIIKVQPHSSHTISISKVPDVGMHIDINLAGSPIASCTYRFRHRIQKPSVYIRNGR